MVPDFIISMCKVAVAIGTCLSGSISSMVVIRHCNQKHLLRQNFVNGFTLRHQVFVEMSHYIWTAVGSWRSLILSEIRYTIAAKAANIVFIDNTSFRTRIISLRRAESKNFQNRRQDRNLEDVLYGGR